MENFKERPFVNATETVGQSPPGDETERYLRLMAGYIMDHTSRMFLNRKQGMPVPQIPSNADVKDYKLQSLFNDWKYWNGVIHMAFDQMTRVLGDEGFRNYVAANYRFFFQNISGFKGMFDQRMAGAPGHQFFRMDRLDDFGAMAAALFEVYSYDPAPHYLEYLNRCMDYIRHQQERLPDGTFCRNRFGYTSLWGDDLYMSVPFLIRAWKFSGDAFYLEDAIKQVFRFRDYLFRQEAGIYYHYRIMQENHPGVAHWGRANGWMVMAQCQLLEALPANHLQREPLIELLKEHLLGLARYQTANGMWRQLLDKSDSFLESSCTAMFTYGFAKAINEGWISDIYTSVALAGWKGLINGCIGANGYLDKVSTGFNFKQDLPFYYNIPIEPGGDHGIGAALYAAIEIYRLRDEFRDCVWC